MGRPVKNKDFGTLSIRNKGMYLDPKGKYKIRVRKGRKSLEISFASEPGVWRSAGTEILADAIEVAEDKLLSLGKSSRPITFGKFAKDFFSRTDADSIQNRDRRFKKKFDVNYYKIRQGYLDNYILPRFEKSIITDITDREIENWYVNLKSINKGVQLADNSKIKIVDALGKVMEEARKQGVIKINPCDRVERIHQESKEREPFTDIEIKRLFPSNRAEMLHIWTTDKWALYFSIMVDTGWRPGEVLAIGRDSIYMGGLFSTRSYDSKEKVVKDSIKTTKKGKKYKVGILSDYSLQLLERVLKEMSEESNYLFIDDGTTWSDGTANKHLRGACRRAGFDIGDRTQYCLRHTFETEMLKSLSEDIRMQDVAELMGHVGYRADYDHTTPQDVIPRFLKAKDILNERRA